MMKRDLRLRAFLTGVALARNSDVFAAGAAIHGFFNWGNNWGNRGPIPPKFMAALAGDGITQADVQETARVAYESSPISAIATWKSPVLLVHADDDRNVEFRQTVDVRQRLDKQGVIVEELVIPDEVHSFLLWRTWLEVTQATTEYLERFLETAKPSE